MSLLAVIAAPVQPFGYNLPWWFFAFSKSFVEFGMVFLSVFPLVGLWSLGYFLFRATSRTWLEMDSTNFRLQRWLLGMCYQDIRERTEDMHQVKLSSVRLLNQKILTSCLLRSKSRKHHFGLFLTRMEKEWLVGELKSFWEN